ncbi:MAG: hypothetical protein L3K06_03445 [Thermoplasmata archaeon]|nr:hypothetical protein [Thermoplasmata archaeon]
MPSVRSTAHAALGVLPAAAPLLLLAIAWEGDPFLSLLVVAVAMGVAVAARATEYAGAGVIAGVLVLGAIAYVAGTAFPDTLSEALLGTAALGAVVWVAIATPEGPSLSVAARGLVLPGLALGIALSVSFLLPVAEQSVGIAVILLVGALALLGWSILRVGPVPNAAAVPPSL